MDIQRAIQKKSVLKKYWYLIPIVLLISLSIAVKGYLGDSSFVVKRQSLQFATVESGDFKVEILGMGQLKPEHSLWLSTEVPGRVEQILVKAGNHVNKGDPIATLSNPDLKRSLEQARWELQASKAEMKATVVQLESQLVDLENSVDEAEFNYKSTKLKLDAESELLKTGRGSISKIDFQRTSLSVEQQNQRWKAQKKRLQKMKDNIIANKEAQIARLELVQSNYASIKSQVEKLTVRATTEGTIQSISLSLGQQVGTGESVAILADNQTLIAELKIPELQVQNIAISQPVIIDTRSTEIRGEVIRIDPRVEGGVVQVDVALLESLPLEARPDLNIEGRITINQVDNTLFVKRPAYAPQNTEVKLFVLSTDERFLTRRTVKLGASSTNRVQVASGLKLGEKIVTSDISRIIKHQQIIIN